MIRKFNRTQIEQSFSLTKLINIKTHFLEIFLSMSVYVLVWEIKAQEKNILQFSEKFIFRLQL